MGLSSFSRTGVDVDFDELAAAGIEYFIVYLDPPSDLSALERFASQVGVFNS